MRRNGITFIAAWSLTALLAGPARLGADEPPTKLPETSPVPPPRPGGGFVPLPYEGARRTESADEHFEKAAGLAADGKWKAAAREVRKGSGFFKAEAGRAAGADRESMLETVEDLEDLASRLATGGGVDLEALRTRFAGAHHAASRHLLNLCVDEWTRRDAAALGRDLQAAVIHLQRGLNWTEARLPRDRGQAIHQAADLGARIALDREWSPEEVEAALKTMETEVEAFGFALEELNRPESPPEAATGAASP